jgi:hypothetical protein
MKKLVFTFAMLLIGIASYCQTDSVPHYPSDLFKNLNDASTSLAKFRGNVLIGSGLSLLGGSLIIFANESDDKPIGIIVAGSVMATAGVFIYLNAFDHIKDASDALKRIGPSSEGIGVAYKIK